jgi:hypothetical protein
MFVCAAACTPSKAVEQTCVPPGSNCASQQAPVIAIAAAKYMGLCATSLDDACNDDGYFARDASLET